MEKCGPQTPQNMMKQSSPQKSGLSLPQPSHKQQFIINLGISLTLNKIFLYNELQKVVG